jgi:hypothetical protein
MTCGAEVWVQDVQYSVAQVVRTACNKLLTSGSGSQPSRAFSEYGGPQGNIGEKFALPRDGRGY